MIDTPFWMGEALLGEGSMLSRCTGQVNHFEGGQNGAEMLEALAHEHITWTPSPHQIIIDRYALSRGSDRQVQVQVHG